MGSDLFWKLEFSEPVIIVFAVTILYLIYHFGGEALLTVTHSESGVREKYQVRRVFYKRLFGAGLLGFALAVVVLFFSSKPFYEYGLAGGKPLESWLFIIGLSAVTLPMAYLNARNPRMRAAYPQIRSRRWGLKLLLLNVTTWGIYLLAYEYCFRGVLLVLLANHIGSWPAIALMTAIYVMVHLPKGWQECIGTLIGGVLFGAAALYTGAIWASFGAHLIIAVGNDLFAAQRDPEVSLTPLRWNPLP